MFVGGNQRLSSVNLEAPRDESFLPFPGIRVPVVFISFAHHRERWTEAFFVSFF